MRHCKPLWGEGQFLRPQHFQRQDAYHEARLAQAMRSLHPLAWGLRSLQVDAAGLEAQLLRIEALDLVLPDGELLQAPGADALPPPLSLSGVRAGASELVVHLALPMLRLQGRNTAVNGADSQASAPARFALCDVEADDWFTHAESAPLQQLQRQPRLVLDGESLDGLVSLPLLRLRRHSAGHFELDAGFVPPLLQVGASSALLSSLRRLLDALQGKAEALYGLHREPSRHVIEFRSGDAASFWLLHTVNAAYGSLAHLQQLPGLHPERLFQALLELAGALMTFSRQYRLSELPRYEHGNPGPGFATLDAMLRDLLETVISTRAFQLALDLVRPSYHQARLDSERVNAETRLYLGVKASLPGTELVDVVPSRFKLGAPDDVDKLVLSAMAGVRLTHTAQVPPAVPIRPELQYFAIEARGPLYERMLQGRTMSLYTPAGMPDLHLELYAINA